MTRKLIATYILCSVFLSTQGGLARFGQAAERIASSRRTSRTIIQGRQNVSPTPRSNPALAAKIRRVLDSYHQRPLDTRQESPWSLLHWAIAFGPDSHVRTGTAVDQPMTAIDWLCLNRPCAGQQLIATEGERLSLPVSPGLQGHHGQFLSMLAQSNVDQGHELQVDGFHYQVRDLIAYEKRTCESGMELTFKLIGIAHYTPSEKPWTNHQGESWSVRRLLVEELDQPIDRMACCCGGTHRLFAWSCAVEHRREEGEPVDGPWATAAARVRSYQNRAFQLQNRDGSFSTLWMDRPENATDLTRSLLTTGHTLEWMVASLPEHELHDPRVERAVYYVADVLERNRGKRWQRGVLGHSLHALAIYEQRVLGAEPGDRLARMSD